jgi:transcriptional regulator with XRE-family HTH domain
MTMEELTKSQFAQTLRTLMKKKNLTGTSLATKAKLSKSAVSNYLGGKAIPNAESQAALAKALGVSVNALAPAEGADGSSGAIYKMESQHGRAFVRINGWVSMEAALELHRIMTPFVKHDS